MKLTHIKATNLLGARNFSTELRAPVLVSPAIPTAPARAASPTRSVLR